MMIKANSTILFQGDSITDADRSRVLDSKLGNGYPAFVKTRLDKEYGELKIKVLNRGISGNRAIDLVNRWQSDCIALQPDYVSILIGVNDTWRRYDSNDPTTDADFKARYRMIIEDTLKNTSAQIVLLNSYLLDVNENITRMREDLCGKQAATAELAKEYKTKYLDLDAVFKAALKDNVEPAYFSQDGVHPSPAGHALIAEEWLKVW